MAPILLSPCRPARAAFSPSLSSPRAAARPSPRAFKRQVARAYYHDERRASIHEPWEVYIADLDLIRGDCEDPMRPTRFVPPMSTVRCAESVEARELRHLKDENVALKEDKLALHVELETARETLIKAREEAQQLRMQLARKEQTVNAYKAERIQSCGELQRAKDRARGAEEAMDSEYRPYVLDAQQELQTARARFVEWPDNRKSRAQGSNGCLCKLGKSGKSTHALPLEHDAAKIDAQPPVTPAPDSVPEVFLAALWALTQLSRDLFLQAQQDSKLLQGR